MNRRSDDGTRIARQGKTAAGGDSPRVVSSGLAERTKDREESFDFRPEGLDALNVGSMRSNSVNTA